MRFDLLEILGQKISRQSILIPQLRPHSKRQKIQPNLSWSKSRRSLCTSVFDGSLQRTISANRAAPTNMVTLHCQLPLLRRLPLGRACSWDLTHVTLRLELLTHLQTPGFLPHKVHLMLTLQALYYAKFSCSLKFYNAQKTRLALTLH